MIFTDLFKEDEWVNVLCVVLMMILKGTVHKNSLYDLTPFIH